jgi:hypothetical protein
MLPLLSSLKRFESLPSFFFISHGVAESKAHNPTADNPTDFEEICLCSIAWRVETGGQCKAACECRDCGQFTENYASVGCRILSGLYQLGPGEPTIHR